MPNSLRAKDPISDPHQDQIKPAAPIFVGSYLEAESYFKSPYFRDSYYLPWNPDPLARGNNYSIYDEMRDDDQVKVAISFKKDIVVNAGWQIICEERPDVREFVEISLKRMQEDGSLQMSFEDVLRDMAGAYEYGFSLAEPIFKIKDGMYCFDSIRVRPPQSFRFLVDDYGTTNEIIQMTNRGEKHYDPALFIHHVYQPEYGNPYGKSDLRAAHSPWIAKKFVSKFLAIYLERFATATVVGKYPSTWDTDEVAKFHAVIKTIQQTSSLVMPDSAIVEFVQANKDSSQTFIQSLDYYNMHIARALLVPDLIGISGSKTAGGSFALGQDQFKLFMATIEKDRQALARKITLRLINPLVAANFGQGIQCDFQFAPFSMDQDDKMLEVWSNIVRTGVFRPNDAEINHIRKACKFPEGPVILGQIRAKETPGVDVNNPNGQPLNSVTAEVAKGFAARRELTSPEKKVNFSQIQKTMEQSEASLSRRIKRAAKQIWKDYVSQIVKSGLIDRFDPQRLNELKPRFLKDLNLELKNGFQDLVEQAYSEAHRELFPDEPKKFGLDEGELSYEDMMDVLNAEAFNITADYAGLASKKVNSIIAQGLKQQLSTSEITALIEKELPDATDSWVDTLVRTKTTEIYNRGRKSYFDNDELAQKVIGGYQFSAILDARTTEICRSLDKKIFKNDDDNINLMTPPLHWNCRSILVPVTTFEKSDLEDAVDAPDRDRLVEMGANLLTERSEVKS